VPALGVGRWGRRHLPAPHGSWSPCLLRASCGNVGILGGTWGPATDQCWSGLGSAHPEVQNAYQKLKRSRCILIEGATFQNFARCASSDHTECMQMEPDDDENNLLRRVG